MSKQHVSIIQALDALTTAANNGNITPVHIDGGVEYIIDYDAVYKLLDDIKKNEKCPKE